MSLWTGAEAAAATGGRAGAFVANGVSIDTRTLAAGDLFVALKGDARDGHEFVSNALERGAAAAMVSRTETAWPKEKLLIVADTLEGLRGLGAASRARSKAKIAAVTGSAGKTSTKETLKLALAQQGETHASAASYNNHWGVPLSLARMPRAAKFAVFEIGMNHPGEITPLVKLVRPHAAIVTTVEAVHLEYFKSVEEIADAKSEIFLGLEPGGVAVINRDNPHYQRMRGAAERAGVNFVWTFGEHAQADARLIEARLDATGSQVKAAILGETYNYRFGAPGRHFALNSLGILLVAKALGADVRRSAQSFAQAGALKGRGERVAIRTPRGTFTLIDESYNANPASMAAAIAVLGGAEKGSRRIAVLGDMLELGAQAREFHAGLVPLLRKAGVDLVFACGPLMAGLWAALPDAMRGAYGESSADIAPLVAAEAKAGDTVMVKGSFGSRMSAVVEALKELQAD